MAANEFIQSTGAEFFPNSLLDLGCVKFARKDDVFRPFDHFPRTVIPTTYIPSGWRHKLHPEAFEVVDEAGVRAVLSGFGGVLSRL